MNVYYDLYWSDKTGWRTNNDYLDSIHLEVLRSMGWEGRELTFAYWHVVEFVCGDRWCMRSREGWLKIGEPPLDAGSRI